MKVCRYLISNALFWNSVSFVSQSIMFKSLVKSFQVCFVLVMMQFRVVAQTSNDVIIGQKVSFHSKILNENRNILVHIPENFEPNKSSNKYPVIYLLDGGNLFNSTVGMVSYLSEYMGTARVMPEMIIVGIRNTDRVRDLTPTHIDSDPSMGIDSSEVRTSGGGENFTKFLHDELIPFIDSVYPTNTYRMLVGYSLGGLIVMNTLIHHPGYFNSYICIDPSMWYDNKKLLNQIKQSLKTNKFSEIPLYLGISNNFPVGMSLNTGLRDSTSKTKHTRSVFELDKIVRNAKVSGLRYESKFYPNDRHSTIPFITIYDGLRFIFSNYNTQKIEK